MAHYRRALNDSTYFFTVVTYRRRPILCDARVRLALRSAFEGVRARLPFQVDAIVLLPDHLHCICTLPDGDANFSTRWSHIKHVVSFACRDAYADYTVTNAQRRRREAAIWQRKFWEHRIRDERDMEKHVDYIHYNPVKHGLVDRAAAWAYSSFGRHVDAGVYPVDWGGTEMARTMMLE